MARPGQDRKYFAAFVAATLALVALPAADAVAKSLSTKQCKGGIHNGQPSQFLPKSFARRQAINNWQSEVQALHGQPWRNWSNAVARSIQCSSPTPHPTAKVVCEAVGRPCRYVTEATQTHPPLPSISINIGIGGTALRRPRHFGRAPRSTGGPRFSGSTFGRRRAR